MLIDPPDTYRVTLAPPVLELVRPKAIRVLGLAYVRVRFCQLEELVHPAGVVDRSMILSFSWPHAVLAIMLMVALFTSSATATTAPVLPPTAVGMQVSRKATEGAPVAEAAKLMTDQPVGAHGQMCCLRRHAAVSTVFLQSCMHGVIAVSTHARMSQAQGVTHRPGHRQRQPRRGPCQS
jgi:hypothetical protein